MARTGALPGSAIPSVVTGTVESNLAEEAETSEGLLAIAECPFNVRVLDPGMAEGARLVAELSGAGRGSRLEDRGEALRMAREDAVRRLTEQLLEALRQSLPDMSSSAGEAG
mgnify:CR=1 FL=1